MHKSMARFDDLDNLVVFQRDVESTPPVVACSDREGCHSDFIGGHLILGENAVNHLVVSAVTAHRNEFAVTFLNNGITYNFNGMTGIFGQHIVKLNTFFD